MSVSKNNHKYIKNDTFTESKNYSFVKQIAILTKVLYIQRGNIKLDPFRFQQMIVKAEPYLEDFFNKLMKTLIPNRKFEHNKIEVQKTIISLYYIMTELRNKFANNLKLKIRLYLLISGITRTAIDTMNSIRLSAYYIIVNNFKRKLANEHSLKIRKFFKEQNNYLYIYNLDDYHNIHKKRCSDNITLSIAKHIATYICKQVFACALIPIVFNNISVYNPININANNIYNIIPATLDIYTTLFRSGSFEEYIETIFKIWTKGETVDSKCFSTDYSTSILLSSDEYNLYYKKLDNSEVLIYGHNYHFECYQKVEYKKSSNVLISKEINKYKKVSLDDEITDNEETNRNQNIYTKFVMALNNINT
ncbi:hypothetical protein Glove_166g202 [Diversispora epigaea]|uniref:Uncharacterized protein n=1 Tax=Diversispora epigaea TaxID=1348612 RepID=A0A397IWX0_9GLOM|nr:hypothetical protein Glove_166g202 [Diversispora epigaea]